MNSNTTLPPVNGGLSHKAITMFVLSPIKDSHNKVIAVLALQMDPFEDFSRISQLGRIGRSGETYAIGPLGILLTRSRFESELFGLGMLAANKQSVLAVRVTDPGVNLLLGEVGALPIDKRPLTRMAKNIISQNPEAYVQTYAQAYRDYRGVPVLGAGVWDKRLNIGLLAEIDLEEALSTWYRIRNILIILWVSIIIFSVLLLALMLAVERRSQRKTRAAFSQLQQVNAQLETYKVELEHKVKDRTLALEQANESLQIQSETDALTGVPNRRAYEKRLVLEVNNFQRNGQSLAVLMIDIDYFKQYNDHYGHAMGDDVLVKVASLARESLPRKTDFFARYGGEEFVVLISDTTPLGLKAVADRMCEHIELESIKHEASGVAPVLTVSIGIATMACKETSVDTLFEEADKALYQAKEQGRNRTVLTEL